MENNNSKQVFVDLRKASYMDPMNRDVRLKMARLLIVGKYYDFARQEIENLLKYYPDDAEVIELIDEIRGLESTPQ